MLTPRFSFSTSNLAKLSWSDFSAIVVLLMLMGLASRQPKVFSLFFLIEPWNFVSSDWILVVRKSFNWPARISSALRISSWRSFGATRPDESPVIALLSLKGLIQELMSLKHVLTDSSRAIIHLVDRSFGTDFNSSNPMSFFNLLDMMVMTWLVVTHCWTFPGVLRNPIIPPGPFCYLFTICSITWSDGRQLNLPWDGFIVKLPFRNLS